MNTDVTAWLWNANPIAASRALREAERAFHAAHARFSRFDAASELSRLNASPGRPFAASPDLYDVVDQALQFVGATGGLFNPAVIDALEAAGYDRTFDQVAHGRDGSAATRAGPVPRPRVTLDPDQHTLTLAAGVRLDLGGIAKGWTVQQTARQLSMSGPCLVDAGGDMLTFGAPPGESGWRVGVADPFDARRDLDALRLRDAAVATSGIDRRRWMRNGVAQHHLIDPRTGRPSDSNLIGVTLIAPTAVEAEVYAKTVFLLGLRAGLRFVDERPSLAALLVTRAGQVAASSRTENYRDVHFVYNISEPLAA